MAATSKHGKETDTVPRNEKMPRLTPQHTNDVENDVSEKIGEEGA